MDKPNLDLALEFASKFENSKEYRQLLYIIQAFNLHSMHKSVPTFFSKQRIFYYTSLLPESLRQVVT